MVSNSNAAGGSGTLRTAIVEQLPYLRRYARALVGSQHEGDGLVRALLESLANAPGKFDLSKPGRVELYRLFHDFWMPASGDGPMPGAGSMLETRDGELMLARLSAHRREALLLTAVEGFSIPEASMVLARSVDEVAEDIVDARASIAAQMAGRVLIIEDEPIIAMDIQSIVEDLGHKVVGIAATRTAAKVLADNNEVDLVLADIQLADGSSGVDAVKDILAEHDLPVIFVTAFPERLLTGERPEPTWLITKPFIADMLVATIGQALLLHRRPV
jgi:DNA-directed RNA polymerase specialized sigma24 family protein